MHKLGENTKHNVYLKCKFNANTINVISRIQKVLDYTTLFIDEKGYVKLPQIFYFQLANFKSGDF